MADEPGVLHVNRKKRCLPVVDSPEPQPCKVRVMEPNLNKSGEPMSAGQSMGATTVTSVASPLNLTPTTVDKSNPPVTDPQQELSSETVLSSDTVLSSHRNYVLNNRCQEQNMSNSTDFYPPHSADVQCRLETNKSENKPQETPPPSEGSDSLNNSICKNINSTNTECNSSTESAPPPTTSCQNINSTNTECNSLTESASPSTTSCQNILELPNSIVLNIFKYLTIPQRLCYVARVCTKWYELSKDHSLWHHICFQDLTHMWITDEILDKVTSYSNHVVHLDLSNIMGFTLNGISALLKKCRHLVYLSLKGCCCLPDYTFRLISQNLPDLEQLYLDDCFGVTNETMIEIFINCPKLTHVSLSSQLNSRAVLTLAEHCPRLRLLNISHCEAVDALAELFQKCTQLENINISNCPLTDRHLIYLSKLSNLKHIYLNSVNMSSKAAKEIAKNCTKLQTLSLCFNKCVDDDCIATVARYAHNLKVLKCIRCSITDQGLTAIGEHCHNLQKLDVSFCNKISNEGVNFVSNKCGKLHFLGLFSCENVETDFLLELEKTYPHILFYCFNLEYNRLIKRASEQGYL